MPITPALSHELLDELGLDFLLDISEYEVGDDEIMTMLESKLIVGGCEWILDHSLGRQMANTRDLLLLEGSLLLDCLYHWDHAWWISLVQLHINSEVFLLTWSANSHVYLPIVLAALEIVLDWAYYLLNLRIGFNWKPSFIGIICAIDFIDILKLAYSMTIEAQLIGDGWL